MTTALVKVEDLVLTRMGGFLGWIWDMGIWIYFDLSLIN
jgi:hypothetical protein